MIRAILCNPSIDVYYKIPKFGEQKVFTSLENFSCPAGKAINFAKAVKILGEDVEVSGIVSGDDILKFKKFLEEYKIAYDLLEVRGKTRINTTIFEEKSQIAYHLNGENEQIFEAESFSFAEKLIKKIEKGDFWAFCGSIPKGFDEEFYKKLITECKAKNVKTALDTRNNPLKFGISAMPFLAAPNETEFQELLSDEVKGLQSIVLKAKRYIDMIEYFFVTLGKDGVVAFHGNECLLCSAVEIQNQVNVVGCGDAFLAGAVVGFQRGFSFGEVCRLATACGAANTLTREPCKIDINSVWRIMEKVKIESV
ncbi:MAG: hexose kinase [Chitinispirillales bacterium]|nr:hexose kinase [Chitinispirillales bacterium]